MKLVILILFLISSSAFGQSLSLPEVTRFTTDWTKVEQFSLRVEPEIKTMTLVWSNLNNEPLVWNIDVTIDFINWTYVTNTSKTNYQVKSIGAQQLFARVGLFY